MARNDTFSKFLCAKCFDDTKNAYLFRKKCLNSNRVISVAFKNLQKKPKTIAHSEVGESSNFIKIEPVEEDVKNDEDSMIVDEEEDEMNYIEYDIEGDVRDVMKSEMIEDEIPVKAEEELTGRRAKTEYLETSHLKCNQCDSKTVFKSEFGLKKHLYSEHDIGTGECCQN